VNEFVLNYVHICSYHISNRCITFDFELTDRGYIRAEYSNVRKKSH